MTGWSNPKHAQSSCPSRGHVDDDPGADSPSALRAGAADTHGAHRVLDLSQVKTSTNVSLKAQRPVRGQKTTQNDVGIGQPSLRDCISEVIQFVRELSDVDNE